MVGDISKYKQKYRQNFRHACFTKLAKNSEMQPQMFCQRRKEIRERQVFEVDLYGSPWKELTDM